MKSDDIWDKMYSAAVAVQNDRRVSEYVEAGGVAAAVLAASGKRVPRAYGSAHAQIV